ncbi:MAG TPA: pilus assembly protein N-terminal domain-containing protein [Rhizomicrobium sp.]|nr:pilus assembly protein N-terminal domain-containing protein [Rhizomicrobium sp.]
MRRALFASSLVLLLPAPAFAADLGLGMDEVKTMTFEKPVATVYVGNPSIADINMIDTRHAFVIGKSLGTTNIMALDAAGKPVSNTGVAVLAGVNTASTVILNRGTQRVTYSCTTSHCDMMAEPGDSKDAFEQITQQLAVHNDTAHKAAAGQ